MKVSELKNLIENLGDDVDVEIEIESGFGNVSQTSTIGFWFNEKDNCVVLSGEEEGWE